SNIVGNADGASSDQLFTGADSDYFTGANWNNVMYITNGVDQLVKYDGTEMSRSYVDLDVEGGPDNDLGNCKFIFVFRGRLMVLHTTEKGTTYRQRARISEVNLPGTWKAASYVDAPADHTIQAAKFIDNDLVVWFDRSVWKLIYTGDPTLPFEWRNIDQERGTIAPQSVINPSTR
ncbi:MAG: hypothetical protein IIC51_08425, partial [Planctomycetes bacterium]|nr:hypothetical protein [Planctomycetota bacterium]